MLNHNNSIAKGFLNGRRKSTVRFLITIAAFLLIASLATEARAEAPCCNITGIDNRSGVVTARVNATGQIFQFAVKDARLLRSLKVGQGVYANMAARQVSLDGRATCCAIVSLGGGMGKLEPRALESQGAVKMAAPSVVNGGPCCAITGINVTSGMVSARDTSTGRTFNFNASANLLKTLKVGQQVYANFRTLEVSVDGRAGCCTLKNVSASGSNLKSTGSAATSSSWRGPDPYIFIDDSFPIQDPPGGYVYKSCSSGGTPAYVIDCSPTTTRWIRISVGANGLLRTGANWNALLQVRGPDPSYWTVGCTVGAQLYSTDLTPMLSSNSDGTTSINPQGQLFEIFRFQAVYVAGPHPILANSLASPDVEYNVHAQITPSTWGAGSGCNGVDGIDTDCTNNQYDVKVKMPNGWAPQLVVSPRPYVPGSGIAGAGSTTALQGSTCQFGTAPTTGGGTTAPPSFGWLTAITTQNTTQPVGTALGPTASPIAGHTISAITTDPTVMVRADGKACASCHLPPNNWQIGSFCTNATAFNSYHPTDSVLYSLFTDWKSRSCPN